MKIRILPSQKLYLACFLFIAMVIQPLKLSLAQESDNRHDLLVSIESFLTHISNQRTDWIELAPDAILRENGYEFELTDSRWQNVQEIVSKQTFADPITGHVIAKTGVRLNSGRIAYVSTRLKLNDGLITEVEISFDDTSTVVPERILMLDPVFPTIVPSEARSTREELERIGRSYFASLSDHRPIAADFDDKRCNRIHSGAQITNNAGDMEEASGSRTCFEAMQGPWGPAVDHRFPIIDPERGILVGITLLHFPNNRIMYVSEIFKILDGKIRLIDNLPVWISGVETLGFPLD